MATLNKSCNTVAIGPLVSAGSAQSFAKDIGNKLAAIVKPQD